MRPVPASPPFPELVRFPELPLGTRETRPETGRSGGPVSHPGHLLLGHPTERSAAMDGGDRSDSGGAAAPVGVSGEPPADTDTHPPPPGRVRRSERLRRQPDWFGDTVCH